MILWNLFLQYLYGDVFTIIRIQVKPKIHSYRYSHLYQDFSTATSIHMKPEISKSWASSRSSLLPYMKYFHKLIAYYIIDYNHYNNINNTQRQVIGYIMSIKRKWRNNLKARYQEQDKFHLMYNNVLPSDYDLFCTSTHKGCCLLNANEYNYKLKSVIRQEDVSEVKNGRWSINKYATRSFLHEWYHGSWLTAQTSKEPLDVCSILYMHHQREWGTVLDLPHHSFIFNGSESWIKWSPTYT